MRSGRGLALILLLAGALGCGGSGRGLFKEYEYEEDVYLDLDGSATIVVNASIPAFSIISTSFASEATRASRSACVRRPAEAPISASRSTRAG